MGTWLFEPGHTAAMFRARHMMVMYVRGHFKNVSGSLVFDPENPAQSSADVAIDAAAIWTGQPQRDAYLHQFVDTRKKCRTQRPSVPRSHSPSESPVAAFLQRVPMALGGSGGRYPGALAELLGEPDNDALRPADIG